MHPVWVWIGLLAIDPYSFRSYLHVCAASVLLTALALLLSRASSLRLTRLTFLSFAVVAQILGVALYLWAHFFDEIPSQQKLIFLSDSGESLFTFFSWRLVLLVALFGSAAGFAGGSFWFLDLLLLALGGYGFFSHGEALYPSTNVELTSAVSPLSEVVLDDPALSDLQRRFEKRQLVSLPAEHPSIVLIFLEGLSAHHFRSMLGDREYLPQLTKLAQRGVVFRNFLANSPHSDGGMIAVLTQNSPLLLRSEPQGPDHFWSAYMKMPSVPRELKAYGYHSAVMAGLDLRYYSSDRKLRALGFDEVLHSGLISEFDGHRHLIFDGVVDKRLYARALEMLRSQKPPLFLMLITVQSHAPYKRDDGSTTSYLQAWQEVDESLAEFYAALDRADFFKNGLLLVTGDHRELGPVLPDEAARDSVARGARVPLFAFGQGVTAGRVDDRLLDQASVFRFLSELRSPGPPLIPASIFVPLHSGGWNDPVVFSLEQDKFYRVPGVFETYPEKLLISNSLQPFVGNIIGQACFIRANSSPVVGTRAGLKSQSRSSAESVVPNKS